jgi:antitoxin (DNA-binding transcriptional repressor) of toxin-antitoxin stability system
MKTVPLREAPLRLDELFEDVQQGSPVLLVQGGRVAKLERIEPPEFGGDISVLEGMLVESVRGPHADWTPQDLEDIARRVRRQRNE